MSNIIDRVAFKSSEITGLRKDDIFDMMIADTIASNVFKQDKEVDHVISGLRSTFDNEALMGKGLAKEDAKDGNYSYTSHSEDIGGVEAKNHQQNLEDDDSTNSTPNPIRMMASVSTPQKRPLQNFANHKFKLTLPSTWQRIPIKTTKNGRRLGEGWTDLFADVLSNHNKECVWVFIRNYVKVESSRKGGSPFWQGTAKCKTGNCPVRVTLSIDAPTDNILTVKYTGNPQHDGKELQSRRIRGEQRFHLAQKFIDNPSLKPSMEYSKQIGEMDSTKFASGNRTGVGISSNAFRLISSRAKKDQRTLEGLEEKIKNIGKEIRMHDKERADECERSTQRKFFGYIQSATVSDDCLRIVLVEEDTTRLYHQVAASAIFYVDATGGLFEDIRDAGRVLYYAMVLGHPFGSAPPLPVAELVTNSHTSDSIKRLFQELRYRE